MKKNILLINPPLYFSNGIPYSLDSSVPPLGVLYLAAYINHYSANFNAFVIDPAAQGLRLKDIAININRLMPFAVGISAMTPQLQGGVELAAFLKKECAVKPYVFLGGPHISADPGFLTRFGDIFDFAITGEAEKTLLDSLEALLNQRPIPRIQEGVFIEDLDCIPFPDRSLISGAKYAPYESLIYSRGCPYHCYYCSRPSISKKVRYRSADNLVKEVRSLFKDGRGKIDFQDDTFTIDRERVMELCSLLLQNRLRVEWRCNTRVDLVDEKLLAIMKDAGCTLIHFGIESGNEELRSKVIKKGFFTNEQMRNVFRICNKLKIKIAAYFIIGHPGESRTELFQTRDVILRSGIDMMGLSIPTPFPGSTLYEIAKKDGVINENIIDSFARKELGEGYSGIYPVYVSERLGKDFVYSFMKHINRRFYFSPVFFIKRLGEDIVSFKKMKQDAGDFLSLVFRGISSRKPYFIKEKERE